MKKTIYYLLAFLLFSCTKEKVDSPEPIPEKQWEKFVGHYKVYDTAGLYLFDANIQHYSAINEFGNEVDSMLIQNFADTMDLRFQFSYNVDENYFDVWVHNGIKDYQNHSWHISRISDDSTSSIIENQIQNDRITLYFHMTNLKYYINESVPYFDCNCKHVYVKQ